jgi:hypothetical protein
MKTKKIRVRFFAIENCGRSSIGMSLFLCAIDSNDLSLQMFKGVSGHCEIYQATNYGPIFVDGVCINDKCDKNRHSHSTLGPGFEGNGDKFALFGSLHFTFIEYEVFGIEFVV